MLRLVESDLQQHGVALPPFACDRDIQGPGDGKSGLYVRITLNDRDVEDVVAEAGRKRA